MKKIIAAVALSLMATTSAYSAKVFSHGYGQWELMAWVSESGNADFCALKTEYRDGKTLSLRQNSHGYTLVVFDPNWYFDKYQMDIDISFNGSYWDSYSADSYDDTPNQVFIELGYNENFLAMFQASATIQLNGERLDWFAGLSGTRHLGNYLNTCVATYGF